MSEENRENDQEREMAAIRDERRRETEERRKRKWDARSQTELREAHLLKTMQDVLVVLRGADLTASECEMALNSLRNSICDAAKKQSVNGLQVGVSF